MSKRPLNMVGYWASQEQYSMQDLLKFVTEAERGGLSSCLFTFIPGGMIMDMVISLGCGWPPQLSERKIWSL